MMLVEEAWERQVQLFGVNVVQVNSLQRLMGK